jgi:hypothetical protein
MYSDRMTDRQHEQADNTDMQTETRKHFKFCPHSFGNYPNILKLLAFIFCSKYFSSALLHTHCLKLLKQCVESIADIFPEIDLPNPNFALVPQNTTTHIIAISVLEFFIIIWFSVSVHQGHVAMPESLCLVLEYNTKKYEQCTESYSKSSLCEFIFA